MRNDPEKASLLAHLFADRRYAAMLGLGFSAGIPYLLVYSTQSAWLSEAKVPIETIGLMSELTIAYKFKFVWAPFLDKYDAPFFSALLGRRRGWIVVSQFAVMLALGRRRFRRSRRMARLHRGFLGGARPRRGDAGRDNRWLAHHGSAGRKAIGDDGHFRDGLPRRHTRRRCRRAVARRQIWLARAYLCMAALMTVGAVSAFLAPEPESDFTAEA